MNILFPTSYILAKRGLRRQLRKNNKTYGIMRRKRLGLKTY